jgi:hypothetical protein
VVGVAEAEYHDVLVTEEGASALEIGDQVGPASGDEGEVHRGGLAGWLGLRLVEVGVVVEEQQAVAAAASEGEADAEQDGAVAAEHDREGALIEDGADGVGEPGRVVAETVGVEQPVPASMLGLNAGMASRVPRRAPSRSVSPAARRASGRASTPAARRPKWEGASTITRAGTSDLLTGTTDTAAKSVRKRASTGKFRFTWPPPTGK